MTKTKPTLLLIDGHSLAFRAFYALSPDAFKTPDGQHTNAVHGFISMMLNILQNEKPTHLAVAFDLSRHSFRTEEYPEYKGTRGETPPEFNGSCSPRGLPLIVSDPMPPLSSGKMISPELIANCAPVISSVSRHLVVMTRCDVPFAWRNGAHISG